MRRIVKGPAPVSLTAHRQTPHCDYDNYDAKDDLRRALVTEQRGLCCYCMGRVYNESTAMKIEHWRCQSRHPSEQLNYRNLLSACLGGEGQPWHLQHCDTRKGDSDLQWNPAEGTHHIETRLRYELDGSIRSNEAVFNDQLDQVLNLNLQFLKNNRKRILDAVLEWWRREKAQIGGPVPRDRVMQQRDKFIAGNNEITPYSPVAMWWLEQKLARMPV
ncbi:retron system putative HNH endonuclease [Geothrix rubra]|uniref:retron system putative HNH endonuclease n=1 Tax=Geothrix rubra TaxID=2927977 RepID=UPI0028688622|nr:retron system putative HNH endonuclease [Geothrix rubra]